MAQNAEKPRASKRQTENSNPENMIPECTLNICSLNACLIIRFIKILMKIIIDHFVKCGCGHLTVYKSPFVVSEIWACALLGSLWQSYPQVGTTGAGVKDGACLRKSQGPGPF